MGVLVSRDLPGSPGRSHTLMNSEKFLFEIFRSSSRPMSLGSDMFVQLMEDIMSATLRLVRVDRGRIWPQTLVHTSPFERFSIPLEGGMNIKVEDVEIPEGEFREFALDLHGNLQLERWRFTCENGKIIMELASRAFAKDQFRLLESRGVPHAAAQQLVNICKLSGVPQMVAFADGLVSAVGGSRMVAIATIDMMLARSSMTIEKINRLCLDLGIPTFTSAQYKVKREILPAAKMYLQMMQQYDDEIWWLLTA